MYSATLFHKQWVEVEVVTEDRIGAIPECTLTVVRLIWLQHPETTIEGTAEITI